MAIINVALTDTFDQWRTKTNTLGTNQGDLANLDAGFTATDLVGAINEIKTGEDLTQLILGDSSGVGNNRIKLGATADMQIFHDGSQSKITNSTGILQLVGDQIGLYSAGGENMLFATGDGSVQLFHNNINKLETTATGITVSGDIATSDNTSGKILVANGTKFDSVLISGDASIASNGSLTIATDAITAGKIQANAVGASEIAAGAVGASEIADGSITSTEFSSAVTLQIKNSSGTVLKTLRSPGS